MSRRGFTLPEILVALLLSVLAVTISAGLFVAAGRGLDSLEGRALRHEATMNGLRWLDEALVGVAVHRAAPFQGEPRIVSFGSAVRSPHGWMEDGTVTVRVVTGAVLLEIPTHAPIVVFDSILDAVLEYREPHRPGDAWLSRWESATTAPWAVRLRLDREGRRQDTVLVYLGDRG